MVTFQYPPYHGSSGVERAFHFSRHLPDHGWQPIVLTARPNVYSDVSYERMSMIPTGVRVYRTAAMDTTRHLSILGRYPLWLALPDPLWPWWFSAVFEGYKLIRQARPDVIWSTYPIPTAHLIGLTLHRLTGVPLVADFRDPMTEEDYPQPKTKWRVYRWIERKVILHCARAVFTANGAKEMYATRYPHVAKERWCVIENGFDEDSFRRVEERQTTRARNEKLVVLHSGVLYSSERDPGEFFKALAALRRSGRLGRLSVEFVFRGAGEEEHHRESIRKYGLEDTVRLAPTRPYLEALSEMMAADALLVFQGRSCNRQVPAKIYEYLRCRRPVFALTDPEGDTAKVLRHAGIDTVVDMDSSVEIADSLQQFLVACREGRAPVAGPASVESCSRRRRTAELAELLQSIGVGSRHDVRQGKGPA